MRKRELLLLFVSIMLLIGGLTCWVLLPERPTSPINRANFDAIRVGMRQIEVEEILGSPEDDYSTGETELSEKGLMKSIKYLVDFGERGSWSRWDGDEGAVWVCFDEKRRVSETDFVQVRLKSPPLRERLRRWLGLAGDYE